MLSASLNKTFPPVLQTFSVSDGFSRQFICPGLPAELDTLPLIYLTRESNREVGLSLLHSECATSQPLGSPLVSVQLQNSPVCNTHTPRCQTTLVKLQDAGTPSFGTTGGDFLGESTLQYQSTLCRAPGRW